MALETYTAAMGDDNVVLSEAAQKCGCIQATGANSAVRKLRFTAGVAGWWIVRNDTTGGYAVNCFITGGVEIAVLNGTSRTVYTDGVDFFGV